MSKLIDTFFPEGIYHCVSMGVGVGGSVYNTDFILNLISILIFGIKYPEALLYLKKDYSTL